MAAFALRCAAGDSLLAGFLAGVFFFVRVAAGDEDFFAVALGLVADLDFAVEAEEGAGGLSCVAAGKEGETSAKATAR